MVAGIPTLGITACPHVSIPYRLRWGKRAARTPALPGRLGVGHVLIPQIFAARVETWVGQGDKISAAGRVNTTNHAGRGVTPLALFVYQRGLFPLYKTCFVPGRPRIAASHCRWLIG
jgi:hypothetical protein